MMATNDQLEPTLFVILGGAGDRTWRKLVPALLEIAAAAHRGGWISRCDLRPLYFHELVIGLN